ncbi:MAG: methyl-accepting chemotaxis protein [Bacteroidales bacterium]|nr:methyl-accepting chemotaxis protein [Bacteroidales bacterium]
MKQFVDLKIGLRFNLIISAILILVFTIFTIFINVVQKKRSISDTDKICFDEVDGFIGLIENEIKNNQELVNLSLKYAHDIFYNFGGLRQTGRLVDFTAINQVSKEKDNVKVPQWYMGRTPVHNDFTIVDTIKAITGQATVTIFQKIEKGYLRVSTNVMKLDGSRAVGTYIPNDSPVIQTIENGETFRGRAYVVNDWYLTAYEPIYYNGKIQGILYVGVKEKNLDMIKKNFDSRTYFQRGYPFIVDNKGKFVIHPTNQGEEFSEEEFFKKLLSTSETEHAKTFYKWKGENKIQYSKYYAAIESYVVVSIYESDIYQMLRNTRMFLIVIVLVIVIIIITAITFLSNSITKGLNKGVVFANKLATGDLSATMDINQKDEVGMLANALNTMVLQVRKSVDLATLVSKGKLSEAEKAITHLGKGDLDVAVETMVTNLSDSVKLAQGVAGGNLSSTIEMENDEIGELDKALNLMVENLRKVVDEIQNECNTLAEAGSELSSSSQQISTGAAQQSASTEEVSSSMEQMTANISQNMHNAQETDKIAIKAAKDIQECYTSVIDTVESMKIIAEKISVVSEIAHKIDLLAINAAIEAARAGEHGKGFAVVAGEVRKLAENSHEAAKEIEELSDKSVKVADLSGVMLADLVPLIQKTSELVQEISAASIEQDSGASQINLAIQQLNDVTQENASSSEQLSSGAEQLSLQAEKLSDTISFFSLSKDDGYGEIEELSRQAESIMQSIDNLKLTKSDKKFLGNRMNKIKKRIQFIPKSKGNNPDDPKHNITPDFEEID